MSLIQQRKNQQNTFDQVLFGGETDAVYEGFANRTQMNIEMQFNDDGFKSSTNNDYLSMIEAKWLRYKIDKA